MIPSMNAFIGPHEGRELELMLRGSKPLAMVSYSQFEDFLPWVLKGRFVYASSTGGRNSVFDGVLVALPHEAWRMFSLEEVYRHIRLKKSMGLVEHMQIGRLLGYSEQEIAAFLIRWLYFEPSGIVACLPLFDSGLLLNAF